MNSNAETKSGAMRVLDKTPKINRRGFLKGSGLAAIGVSVVSATGLMMAPSEAFAAGFEVLGADTGKTLLRMARDIFPHDRLADKYYAEAVEPYDQAAAKDGQLKQLIADGVRDLDALAKKRHGKKYVEIPKETDRVTLLKSIESSPFFQKIKGDLVTGLYNNKAVWPLLGYEGSSWEKGGYINRGFDDIDWL
jgi:hypothetical protein